MIVTGTFAKPGDEETMQTSAEAPTYEEALAKVEAQTPEGFRMINIRVAQ